MNNFQLILSQIQQPMAAVSNVVSYIIAIPGIWAMASAFLPEELTFRYWINKIWDRLEPWLEKVLHIHPLLEYLKHKLTKALVWRGIFWILGIILALGANSLIHQFDLSTGQNLPQLLFTLLALSVLFLGVGIISQSLTHTSPFGESVIVALVIGIVVSALNYGDWSTQRLQNTLAFLVAPGIFLGSIGGVIAQALPHKKGSVITPPELAFVKPLIAFLLVGLIVLNLVAVIATQTHAAAAQAEIQATTEKSRALIVSANLALQSNETDRALLLNLLALKEGNNFPARSSLLNALQSNTHIVKVLHSPASLSAQSQGSNGYDTQEVRFIDSSKDGKKMVTATYNGSIIIWDVDLDNQTYQSHIFSPAENSLPNGIEDLKISPDGTIIGAAGLDGTTLWNVSTGKVLFHENNRGHSLAFYPNGHSVVIGGCDPADANADCIDGLARSYDLNADGTLSKPYVILHMPPVWSMEFSPDGRWLALSGCDANGKFETWLWDAQYRGGSRRLDDFGPDRWRGGVAFSSDGKRLVSSGCDTGCIHKQTKVWDMVNPYDNAPIFTAGLAGSVTFGSSPNQVVLATCGDRDQAFSCEHRQLVTLDLTNKTESDPYPIGGSGVGSKIRSLPPKYAAVALGSSNGQIILWNGQENGTDILNQGDGAPIVAFSNDGVDIVVDVVGTNTMIFDLTNKDRDVVLTRQSVKNETSLAYNTASNVIAAGTTDGKINISSTLGGYGQTMATGNTGSVTSLAFSPDGTQLASVSCLPTADNPCPTTQVTLWAMKGFSSKQVPVNDDVQCVTFSADGKRLAVGGKHTVSLWNLATNKPSPMSFGRLNGTTHFIALNTDGTLMATGSDVNDDSQDGMETLLWETNQNRPLGNPFHIATNTVLGIGFRSSNNVLEVAALNTIEGNYYFVYGFNTSLDAWKTRACTIANRELTAAEVQQLQVGQDAMHLCS